jgi:D-alanyl-D-alanine carboxypeptidase
MKRVFPGPLFFLVFSSACFSQSLDAKKLDSLFDMLQRRGLANGSVAISINGKVVYERAVGFSSREKTNIPSSVNTKYRIGSVSKMFTAVMIFQLIEEGKLSLKEKLSAYFPQLPNATTISIEDLLYHRSGLHDYTKDTNFPEWMDKPKSQSALLKIIAEKGADFEPGKKYDYCNSNYLVLSYIIEKIGKTTYAAALGKRIISKIGLENTYYGKPIDLSRNESQSYKYSDSNWQKEKETNPGIHIGAGAIVSTPADLVKFIHQLFELKLIGKSSVGRMKTIIDGYGMGMFPYDFAGTTGYGHNGRIEEFYSALRYYPGKKLAISYITNGILFPRTEILDGILQTTFNEPWSIPFSKSSSSNLEKYAGEYAGSALPFKVVCKKDGDNLFFEAGGKTMEIEPIGDDLFMNLKAGTFFRFNPAKGELIIMETDNAYVLHK